MREVNGGLTGARGGPTGAESAAAGDLITHYAADEAILTSADGQHKLGSNVLAAEVSSLYQTAEYSRLRDLICPSPRQFPDGRSFSCPEMACCSPSHRPTVGSAAAQPSSDGRYSSVIHEVSELR